MPPAKPKTIADRATSGGRSVGKPNKGEERVFRSTQLCARHWLWREDVTRAAVARNFLETALGERDALRHPARWAAQNSHSVRGDNRVTRPRGPPSYTEEHPDDRYKTQDEVTDCRQIRPWAPRSVPARQERRAGVRRRGVRPAARRRRAGAWRARARAGQGERAGARGRDGRAGRERTVAGVRAPTQRARG